MLEGAMLKLFTRGAQVLGIEDIGGAFRLVTLEGEALRNVAWTPGDKIQIQLGGWTQRTYTPMGWDADNGRTRILVHLHGDAPGTRWARALRVGDQCIVFGPRKSVRLSGPPSTVIVFGDETSLGLAAALSHQLSAPTVIGLFEVSSPADAARAAERLDLNGVALCARLEDDRHFAELEQRMTALLREHPAAELVLTGRAGAIQHISRLLRQHGVASERRTSKAYWAPGKSGMD
ncbi:siderophore-interacting protein [Duganella sp. SAP-35]|uniref:Siderophore-interacting protein n=2 Tax=Duganella aceris TaxID=2703883 RepID=A0ABX0FLS6_9BURK|nr:siderophore-interacting protein [Duganella aceris]